VREDWSVCERSRSWSVRKSTFVCVHVIYVGNRRRTSECDFSRKNYERFGEFFLFFSELFALGLHAAPWDDEAYALSICVEGFAVGYFVGYLACLRFVMLLSWSCSYIVWLVLESEEEIILVAMVAQVAPNTEDGVGREDVLVWRHGDSRAEEALTLLLVRFW
jgi:hypothetical protein